MAPMKRANALVWLSVLLRLSVAVRLLPRTSMPRIGSSTMPADFFARLSSPEAYLTLVETASPETISVVKWGSPACRTCRAAAAKLNSMTKQWPDASFYEMEAGTKGAMFEFFQEQNVTRMPFIEVYVGSDRVEALVVPPSRVQFVKNALFAARQARLTASRRREVAATLLMLRESRNRLRSVPHSGSFILRVVRLLRPRFGRQLSKRERRAQRGRRLLVLRGVAAERAALLAECHRLERRLALLRKLVLPKRRLMRPN